MNKFYLVSFLQYSRLFQWTAGGLPVHVDLQLDLSCDYLAVPWFDGSKPFPHLLRALHLVSDQQRWNCHLLVRDSGQGTHVNERSCLAVGTLIQLGGGINGSLFYLITW